MRRCGVQDAIDRIAQLEAAGRLTGLMDDRGKVGTLYASQSLCPGVTSAWDVCDVPCIVGRDFSRARPCTPCHTSVSVMSVSDQLPGDKQSLMLPSQYSRCPPLLPRCAVALGSPEPLWHWNSDRPC